MKQSTKRLATLGLIFITFLAAIQYVFLNNVPEDVSTFSFVCITNLIGLLVLFAMRAKHVLKIQKRTLKKGAVFAFLLTGFNLFVLLGSRGMDSVVISSTVSLYFVFVTPLLLLLRKKANFFSSIATVIAVIALLLMFGGDAEALFKSTKVIYLIIADIFFAAYVVGVSVMGEGEDSSALTFSQMVFSSIFSFVGWTVEAGLGQTEFHLPTDMRFWISAVFIGIFIRAVYGLLQITCQKHVSAISASLIFSSEIIITILMDPIMSRLLHTKHTPATFYQIVGAVLLILATMAVDEDIMAKVGYEGMDEPTVARKMMVNTLTFSMVTLVVATIISLSSIYFIRNSAVSGSTKLGEDASDISTTAMVKQLENSIIQQAEDKAKLAEQKLEVYSLSVNYAANFATSLYKNPNDYPNREVQYASEENAGIWAMQLGLENTSVNYDNLRGESRLLGNMEDAFSSMVQNTGDVLSVYMATESGLMISYDKYSQLAVGEENLYYEFKDSEWYNMGRSAKEAVFTDTYWDGYGRGLTITCVAPFYDAAGQFQGCVAMDVLMTDLNASMVNDGIVDPSVATLIDNEGNVIASKDIAPDSEETFSIFDEDKHNLLKDVGRDILEKKDGILSFVGNEEEVYVAFSTIDSTEWILCITSPVSAVLAPSVEIRDSINDNTTSVVTSVLQGVLKVIQNLLVLMAAILLLVTLAAGRFSRRISDPLKKLTEDVMEISGGNLDRRTEVDTDDEIGGLARSFNTMTDSLQKYITDLTEATAREERIAGELSVATHIQAGMIPTNFSEVITNRNFDLYGSMDPAKEVGGDFYDFFMVDEDHIGLVMADVSGKGVPAALFMVIAKTLIKNNMQMDKSVEEVLSDSNNQLAENNEELLFVTAWVAVVSLKTGEVTYADAGHEYALVAHPDGSVEEIHPAKKKMPLAAMEDMVYAKDDFKLGVGDKLFLYTDGVPEAMNAASEQYGMERLEKVLGEHATENPKDILSAIRRDVDDFVGDAPQFDDLTMMAFELK